MNKKQIWISIICSILLFSLLPNTVIAKSTSSEGKYDAKDEVIYGNLNGNGEVEELYVVNSFSISKPGEIADYGDYQGVRNLTDLSKIDLSNQKVTFQAKDEEYYYQGELKKTPLPWDISITYLLDGKEVKPNELAGKSGHLDIQITTTENEEVEDVFFDYYLLQISLTFDPLKFKNIQAPKATEANEGKNKNFSFSIMPAQEEELIVSTDVTDFEMEPIDISAVPANIAMDDPDITGMKSDMKKLADGIMEINNGVKELTNGLSEWKKGAIELESGSQSFKDGIEELDNSSDELVKGSEQILNALQKTNHALENTPNMDDALGDLAEIKALPNELRTAAKEFRKYSNAIQEIENALKELPEQTMSEEQFEKIKNILKESSSDQATTDMINQLEKMYQGMLEVGNLKLNIPDNATDRMTNMADELESFANEIEHGMANLEQLSEMEKLQTGIMSMAAEYKTFHQGLVTYADGVHQLAESYKGIDQGINGLTDGAVSLEDGARKLQEGTEELHDKTANLPDDMQTELDKMMDEFDFSNFEPVSFVSTKNKNVDVVQFVLKTEKIEIPEPETTTTKPKKKNLWDRFLDLFK